MLQRCSETESSSVWLDSCGQTSLFVCEAKLVRNDYIISVSFSNNVVLVNRLPGIVKHKGRNELGVTEIGFSRFNY